MACRLVAIDKCPGVRPIGIGELWRRLFAKTVLSVCGKEAKNACGTDQLCAGLESGIEGGLHDITSLWEQKLDEEEYGFLLIDASNAFNELNRIAMLWVVSHEWPSGARFVFNCYRHYTTMVIRSNDRTGAFILSKEGVTQGDPLSMVVYVLGLLPLIRQLKQAFPAIKHTWYADDALAASSFMRIRSFFNCLQRIGPAYGYFPEPRKSV
jgi:Reverse transcriptase (RNA-dependent DNA polymerase)